MSPISQRLHPSPWLWLVAFALTLPVITARAVAAEPVEAARPAGWKLIRQPVEAARPLPPVPELITQLGSPVFTERAEATRQLIRTGASAVDGLRDAALSNQPEVSVRAIAVLEEIWLDAMERNDLATSEPALGALINLAAEGDEALKVRIDTLFAAHAAVIEHFSLNELRRMGAFLKFKDSEFNSTDDGRLQPLLGHVVIGLKWKGGEDGLRHLLRLRTVYGKLKVYFIDGAPLPEGAVERFEAVAPTDRIAVSRRGGACLGATGSSIPEQGVKGCLIAAVEPGSAADKAGLMPRDVIIRFNQVEVRTIDQVAKQIESFKPGDVVEATIQREGRQFDVKITLDEWK